MSNDIKDLGESAICFGQPESSSEVDGYPPHLDWDAEDQALADYGRRHDAALRSKLTPVPNGTKVTVSRFEVIDHTSAQLGRVFLKRAKDIEVTFSIQDDGRTLKVFIDNALSKLNLAAQIRKAAARE